jgi:hypothetical protein
MPTQAQNDWVLAISGVNPAAFEGGAAAAAAAAQNAKHDAALAKARQVWLATRQKVEKDIATLQSRVRAAYDGHDMAKELEDAFAERVEPVLTTLDETLAHRLDEIVGSEAFERAALVQRARAVIADYEKFLDTDDVIDHIDRNPLVPLSVRKTLETVLDNLAKVIGA